LEFNVSWLLGQEKFQGAVASSHHDDALLSVLLVFGSVVVFVFQIAFHAEIHVNDFFYF
jgi:hypothetical protein